MKIVEFANGIAQANNEPPHLHFESLNSQYDISWVEHL